MMNIVIMGAQGTGKGTVAGILKDELNIRNTCRISLYFYNTKEEIDKLVEVLNDTDNLYKVII